MLDNSKSKDNLSSKEFDFEKLKSHTQEWIDQNKLRFKLAKETIAAK